MSVGSPVPEQPTPDLIWVGNGGWVAHDPSLPDGDARRVIAYLEHRDGLVEVLWVRNRQGVRRFETLREAVQDVAAACRSEAVPADDGEGPSVGLTRPLAEAASPTCR